jgi:hypothetical protein
MTVENATLVDEDATSADPRRASNSRVVSPRRTISLRFAAAIRWLHIYISMFGLAIVLFFSATGVTLNHPDWFFGELERSARAQGVIDSAWLAPRSNSSSTAADSGSDPGESSTAVDKLAIAEFLRAKHRLRGIVSEFRVDDDECTVSFKGPGYAADAFIDRTNGRYQLTITDHGLIAILNDLHKGRDSGKAWSIVIDISAIFLTFISASGLILLFYLKRRRVAGMLIALVGAIAVAAIALAFVP